MSAQSEDARSCSSTPAPDSSFEIVVRVTGIDTVLSCQWGDSRAFGTAAYWLAQYRLHYTQHVTISPRLGNNLVEEVTACLLGGFGIRAEVALMAFERLRYSGAIRAGVAVEELESLLLEPLELSGGLIRYRFPRQRARRIAEAVNRLALLPVFPTDPLDLRNLLVEISGIGPKTASWIVRNLTGAQLAVVDVHVHRAGLRAGFFATEWKLPRHYSSCEEAFLGFARLAKVDANRLDMLIWDQMRRHRMRVPSLLGVGPSSEDMSAAYPTSLPTLIAPEQDVQPCAKSNIQLNGLIS